MIDPADMTDYRLRRDRNHMTGGGNAVWGLDPSEILARQEEAEESEIQREREALREEIFNALLEYLFADGLEPWHVSARARAFVAGVIQIHPCSLTTAALQSQYAKLIRDSGDDFWKTVEEVAAALRPYAQRIREIRAALSGEAPLSTWFADLAAEPDRPTVNDSLRILADLLFSQGHRPRQITGVAYCLAKTLKPHLIAGMSLHTIAILSGDKGRATPQARIERIYTRLLEKSGCRATRYAHQKTASTAEKCRAAQMGNSNRTKNHQSPKRTNTK
jgi:hypothetical protein